MKIEKEHRKSTLMSWTKEQLIEYIMCLEYNNNVLNERLDQQAKKLLAGNTGSWIPCSEKLPENAKHKGALCPKYLVITKHGETIGWYNPDFESWFILVWFVTARYAEEEIDFYGGDVPKVVRAPINTGIVIAWQPLPKLYQS